MDSRHGRSAPRRAWPGDDALLTASMVLSETYVQSSIEPDHSETPDVNRAARGIVNGLVFSALLWGLLLLPFLIL